MNDNKKFNDNISKLAYWSVVFVCISIVQLVLHFQSVRSILYEPKLPILLRAGVFSTEIIHLAVFICIIALFSNWLLNPSLKKLGVKGQHRLLSFILAWILVITYLSSWGTFEIVGIFINYDSLRMFYNDPVQMFQHATHISPLLVLSLLTLSLILAWWQSIWLVNAVNRVSNKLQQLLFSLGFIVIMCAIICILLANYKIRDEIAAQIDHQSNDGHILFELYSTAKKESSGPLSTLVSAKFSQTLDEYREHINIDRFKWQPIISMEDYKKTIDKNHLDKKNVIVILIESLRTDQLPVYQGRTGVMPALEDLAKKSMVFNKAYTQSSHSNYADLGPLSSQYPLRSNGMHFYPKNPDYPRVLLHDIFHSLGYRTSIFSSQNENWGNMLNFLNTGKLDHILHAENYTGKLTQYEGDDDQGSWGRLMLSGDKPSGKIDDHITVDEAIKWIGTDRNQPFFMYMNLQTSHFPYDIPADFPRRFVKNPQHMPVYIGSTLMFKSVQTIKDLYADSLFYIDAQLARLFDHLRNASLLENTVIVVSADTGTAFNEHGSIGNAGQLFNEIVKVPLIIYSPTDAPGFSDKLIQHIDVPPSVLHLLGLPPHPAFQGINTYSDEHASEESAFLVCQTPLTTEVAIVNNDWKLMLNFKKGQQFLFNLTKDPGEQQNIISENPDKGQALLKQLKAWIGIQLTYYETPSLHKNYYPPAMNQPNEQKKSDK